MIQQSTFIEFQNLLKVVKLIKYNLHECALTLHVLEHNHVWWFPSLIALYETIDKRLCSGTVNVFLYNQLAMLTKPQQCPDCYVSNSSRIM